MDISDLKAFVMLAETLNFTRAAEAMFLSQSTFSRQIGKLEAEMGVSLFQRGSRGVSLTHCGQVFLPEAKEQIAAWEASLRHMEQVRSGIRGTLSVGFIQDHPNDRFPEILRAYRSAYPEVRIHLSEYGQDSIVRAVMSGSVDVAFTFAEGIAETPGISSRVLESSPICAVLWAGNPLSQKEQLSLGELSNTPLLHIGPEVSLLGFQDVMGRCRRGGFTPTIAAEAKIIPSLFLMIEADLGFAFLPESAKRIAPDGIRFVRLKDCPDEISTILAWREENKNPCLSEFLQLPISQEKSL